MLGRSGFFAAGGPAWVRRLSMLALAAGAGVWGALLFAPAPRALPPMLQATLDAGPDTAPVARWFGGAALRVRVAVAGVIATGDGSGGAALLSVDGGPAQAYRVGQALAPGVTLVGVSAGGVSIDQDGVVEQVAPPAGPPDVGQGFVPAAEGRP